MMQFIFFDAADNRLFVRDDAETATWSVKGMQLTAEFPFVKEKEIARGMRVGFSDDDGIFQPFEVRKVKTYEPDHYQEITAEHIAIAELTDEFYQGSDATDETASAALGTILTGTLWQVGNVTASNLSSADLDKGTVWQNVRNIEANWNVWITPRVTFSDTGITGRYLDIAPAEGVWRGVTLSINGNADEMGVTVDDSETYTAAYGMGGAVGDDSEPLDFSTAVWTETAEHPAKPEGQKYVEDPAAKALYGRNGRNRFTYYQNADIKEAELLLQKTWDYLQTVNKPKVTIECIVRDLKRMGYAGEGIRRHDLVQVRIAPIGQIVVLTVDDLEVDLLDPTATRPTIGQYIPNIVYINRETMNYASGGGGGGQTETQYEKHVFEQEIYRTERSLELEAYERQLVDGELSDELTEASAKISISAGNINSICAGVGATLDAQGHVVVNPTTGVPVFSTDNPSNLYSQIRQESNRIGLVVSGTGANAQVNTASIILAINGGTGHSSAKIEADEVLLSSSGGTSVTLGDKVGVLGSMEIISGGYLAVDGALYAQDDLYVAGDLDVGNGSVRITEHGSIDCGSLTVDQEIINVANIDVAADGSHILITYVDGSSLTFNKAVSLSGGWDGAGTYSVSATSGMISGQAPSTTANISLTGNGGSSFSAELLDPNGNTQTGKSKTGYLHQSGNSVGVYTTYSGGSYSGLIASVPVSGGSYSFSCAESAATWTQSISGYLNCGTISKSSVQANAYLRFRIKCDNAYKYCYITVNP